MRRRAFATALVVGYWLTNVLGLILLHQGVRRALTDKPTKYSRRDLLQDLGVSLLYTLLILGLVAGGILKPIQSYFGVESGAP